MPQLSIQQALDLALQHHQAGRLPQAEAIYRQILQQQPNHADALHLLGVVALQTGQPAVAADLIGRAVAIQPNYPQAQNNLGEALRILQRFDEAIAAFQQAITLEPNNPEAHFNIANAWADSGQYNQAIAAYRQAIALRPDYLPAYNNLGAALQAKGALDESADAYRRAISLNPDKPGVYCNLGSVLQAQGQLDEALAEYRRAIAFKPDYSEGHSSLILGMHYHPGYDATALAAESRAWNLRHAEPLKKLIRSHANERDTDRPLRIGYVSPDFREHPIARFLLPLLAHHDKTRVEVFAYAQVPKPDAITHQLREHIGGWRSIVGLSDAAAADLIRQDKIDILVDLAAHSAGNRLLIFARKPAPVQVTYLAYCSTTGMETMDYRLSDPYLDPPGMDESVYAEQTVRLPETYWCYQPSSAGADVSVLPVAATGTITFGCLNNFCKVNDATLMMWAAVLRSLPHSKLLIHTYEGSHRLVVHQRLERAGIEPERIRLVGKKPMSEYFTLYDHIDIALDTFPFGGGTTTCDALWMGVPVVSLVGKTAVGRTGLSILSNVGLPELAAQSEDEYVRIAVELANDLPRLNNLRETLRPRMELSPLMDAPRFVRNIEAAYRQMWQTWCEKSIGAS
jgi:predicted O-linked N-acetylglucosamine transferase (SPINDLY family)